MVKLVAVSKTMPIPRLRAAAAAGITRFGENRVQEAEAKVEALPGLEWHLVGQLQGNKAGRALESFSVIQSVDSVALAERLSRLAGDRTVRLLLQVNVDTDPAKAGFLSQSLDTQLGSILDLPGIDVLGLMTVGRLVARPEDARSTFVALRRSSERLRRDPPRPGAGAVHGHERRLRSRDRGGGDHHPGRSGALWRPAARRLTARDGCDLAPGLSDHRLYFAARAIGSVG